MQEYENKDTGFVGDAPAKPQWNTPEDLLTPDSSAQPPITPATPVRPEPPVREPITPPPGRRSPPEETPVYSTGVVPCQKSRKGLILILILAGLLLIASLLAALGLIPGLPNYRFADSDSGANPAIEPGFQSEASTTPGTEGAPSAVTSGDTTVDLVSVPRGEGQGSSDGTLTLQEIYAKTIDSVTSIICDTGTGTGVVMTKDGYIITNYHVIQGSRKIEVLLSDGRQLPATAVGRDEISDLAVLRINANDLTPAVFGNSDQVQVGDTVVAIGDPLGVEFRGTMTDGIISAINRDVVTDQGRTMTVIQTNAALNPGNSGGPLINVYGQVIGINTMKIGDSVSPAGVEGLGFAIPSTTVKTIVDQLMTIGHVTGRPYLGIDTEEYGVVMSYLLPPGLYISRVIDGTDAAAKGILPGEVLLEFNGVAVTTNYELQSALEKCEPGQTVTLVLYRQGARFSIDIVLGEVQ